MQKIINVKVDFQSKSISLEIVFMIFDLQIIKSLFGNTDKQKAPVVHRRKHICSYLYSKHRTAIT